jgi:hypothetical protein
MKKVVLMGLIVAMVLAVGPLAMAKSNPQFTCAPTGLIVDVSDPAEVCFDWLWECPGTPVKYSIDVELLVSGEGWDDPLAEIQQLSFCTGDRTDGALPSDTFLCVPIEGFVYWDGLEYVPFTGDARAKVKALGKGRSQNNYFSDWSEFTIEGEPGL